MTDKPTKTPANLSDEAHHVVKGFQRPKAGDRDWRTLSRVGKGSYCLRAALRERQHFIQYDIALIPKRRVSWIEP